MIDQDKPSLLRLQGSATSSSSSSKLAHLPVQLPQEHKELQLPEHLNGCNVIFFGLTSTIGSYGGNDGLFPPSVRRDSSRYGHCSFTLPIYEVENALSAMLPKTHAVCYWQPLTKAFQQERCHTIFVFGSDNPAHRKYQLPMYWETSWNISEYFANHTEWEQLEFAFVLPPGEKFLSFPAAEAEVRVIRRVKPVVPSGGTVVSLRKAQRRVIIALVTHVCATKAEDGKKAVQLPASFRELMAQQALADLLHRVPGNPPCLAERVHELFGKPNFDGVHVVTPEAFLDAIEWVDRE